MPDIRILQGGAPTESTILINVDNETLEGDGSLQFPLKVVVGGIVGGVLAAPALNAGANLKAGNPVFWTGTVVEYCDAATAEAAAIPIGVLTADVANGGAIAAVWGGLVTLTVAQWDVAIGGSGGLQAGAAYYVAPTGVGDARLTATPPSAGGQWVTRVGVAISSTQMLLTGFFGPIAA